MKVNLITLACYGALGLAIGDYLAPGEWEISQYLAYFAVLLLVLLIDVLSYRNGLKRGTEIANDVLHDLCKTKKIKVVVNE